MASVLRPVRDWIVQNRRRRFWLSEVVQGTGIERKKVLRVLEKLRRQGFFQIVDERSIPIKKAGEYGPPRRDPKFELLRDIEKLRVAKRPSITCRDKIWRTLRILRMTTRGELARLTGCSEVSVREYMKLLAYYGYVREAGKKGREKRFALVKNPGAVRPETPEIRKAGGNGLDGDS